MSVQAQEPLTVTKIVLSLCKEWEDGLADLRYNPTSILHKLSDIIEAEVNKCNSIRPYPFDSRALNVLARFTELDLIFKMLEDSKIELIKKLTDHYLKDDLWPTRTKDNHNLNIAACRLFINFHFGLNFELFLSKRRSNKIVRNLFSLAENHCGVLQTYAVGLLGFRIKCSNNSTTLKKKCTELFPILLNRLQHNIVFCEVSEDVCAICEDRSSSLVITKAISSDWIEIYPLTLSTKLYIHFITLDEMIKLKKKLIRAHEESILNLILKIIIFYYNSSHKLNEQLTFEALKYLNLFLSQRSKMAECVAPLVLQKLLLIPKVGISSSVVPLCFYNMSQFKECLEKIFVLPTHTLVDITKYELWMLKHSTYATKQYVLQFFKYTFHSTVMLEIFDNCSGLFEIINMITPFSSILEPNPMTNRFLESQKLIYYFLDCLKAYFIAHLNVKAEDTSIMVHTEFSIHNYETYKSSQTEDLKKIDLLSSTMSIHSDWTPVDEFLKFKGLSILLKIINNSPIYNILDRQEIIKNALDVIHICAVLPKVQLLLCEPCPQIHPSDPPAEDDNVGMNVLMKTTEEGYFSSATKALSIILTCVRAPLHWGKGSIACNFVNEASKKQTHTTDNYVGVEHIWDCIRNNHGIMVLLKYITDVHLNEDADKLAELACQALAELARSENVYKIISKLPVFKNDQLKEHLTNQHALCEHPVLKLPDQYGYFNPKPRSLVDTNFAVRFSKNIHSRRLDHKLVFSRFIPSLKFDSSENTNFLCGEFLRPNRFAIGTDAGDIIVLNIFNGKQELLWETHLNDITNLECSYDGKLLATSSKSAEMSSVIWAISDTSITQKFSLDEHYCKFSNYNQTKLLGTKNEVATIYDVETSHKIMTLVPRLSNKYFVNEAVFDPTNALVLSDGILWDANAGKEIHKFDKLNRKTNGVFHPNGLEIILNSEVWDVRTFELLRSVSDLNHCNVMFSKTGKGMYSYAFGKNIFDNKNNKNSFNSFDLYDYSTLTEVHTKRNIIQMCSDVYDNQVAAVEYLKIRGEMRTCVELFDIGKLMRNYR